MRALKVIPLASTIVVLGAVGVANAATGSYRDGPLTATFSASTLHPNCKQLWPVTVTATYHGHPAHATSFYQFLYNGSLVSTQNPWAHTSRNPQQPALALLRQLHRHHLRAVRGARGRSDDQRAGCRAGRALYGLSGALHHRPQRERLQGAEELVRPQMPQIEVTASTVDCRPAGGGLGARFRYQSLRRVGGGNCRRDPHGRSRSGAFDV